MSRNSIKIAVQTPCDANLDDMQTVGNGKFCNHCSTTVWDFTNWSEEELGHFFSNKNEAVCGKFLDLQLNKPIAKQPRNNCSGQIAAAALGFSLFFSAEAFSQSKKPISPSKNLMIQNSNSNIKLFGMVRDSKGIEIPSLSVCIQNSLGAEINKVFTDKDGCFEFDFLPEPNEKYYLVIDSQRAMHPYRKEISKSDFWSKVDIYLINKRQKIANDQLIKVGMHNVIEMKELNRRKKKRY